MPLFQALMHDIYLQKRPLCQGTSKSVPTEYRDNIEFTLLRLMLPSYRNQSIDLQAKWVKSTEGVCFIVGFQTDHIWSNSKNKKRRSTFYKFTSKSLCFEFESQTFNPWLVPSFFPFFKFACNTKKTLQLPMFFFFFSFSYMLLDLLLKFFCVCFIDCYPGYVWPVPEKFHCTLLKMFASQMFCSPEISCVTVWHAMCFRETGSVPVGFRRQISYVSLVLLFTNMAGVHSLRKLIHVLKD